MKNKKIRKQLIALVGACATAILATGCVTLPPTALTGASPQTMAGAAPSPLGSAMSRMVSPERSSMPGGLGGTDATKFAQSVKSMRIGTTTKDEVIAQTGPPFSKNLPPQGETWIYALNTGEMPGGATLVFNASGTLKGIRVTKTSIEMGSISSETVYQAGSVD